MSNYTFPQFSNKTEPSTPAESTELKAKDIPNDVNPDSLSASVHCSNIMAAMIQQELDRFIKSSIQFAGETDKREEHASYHKAFVRYTNTKQLVNGACVLLDRFSKKIEYSPEHLTRFGDAITRDNPDLFEMLPLLYRLLDVQEDMFNALSELMLGDKEDETIKRSDGAAAVYASKISATMGASRFMIGEAIRCIDDGTIDMEVNK